VQEVSIVQTLHPDMSSFGAVGDLVWTFGFEK